MDACGRNRCFGCIQPNLLQIWMLDGVIDALGNIQSNLIKIWMLVDKKGNYILFT